MRLRFPPQFVQGLSIGTKGHFILHSGSWKNKGWSKVNDNPDTWFAKRVLAFSFPVGILALGVVEDFQDRWRSRHQQTQP